ncbi:MULTISPECIES: hypothetical protein [unclassified Pseudomonas]|uniref:hypothetical protein n=1 Tax=unclassified Pseudomonas TaxID=196821 RepID=UPI002097C19F|nr:MULTISPECIES: hypothetical protein [unclassified Pseudomonas]MCO7505956.1 hypothetical protein [Pseudomonas sp. VE 267-6A]MCO7528290.1 hypothetical protein [Pseudomonas sp. 2]
MNANLLTLSLGLLLAPACWAAYPPEPTKSWKLEPDSFVGIKLDGSNLAELTPCPADAVAPTSEPMCLEQTSLADFYSISGTAYIGLVSDYLVGLKLNAGQLEYLSISGSAEGFNDIHQLLVSRYGQPTRRESKSLEMRNGLMFNNDILIWEGKQVTITLQRNTDNYRQYSATFTNIGSHPELAEVQP